MSGWVGGWVCGCVGGRVGGWVSDHMGHHLYGFLKDLDTPYRPYSENSHA